MNFAFFHREIAIPHCGTNASVRDEFRLGIYPLDYYGNHTLAPAPTR
jgi:hypothetical protein